jgi:hypothetical protein
MSDFEVRRQAKGRLERKPLAAGLVVVESLDRVDRRVMELIQRKIDTVGSCVICLAAPTGPCPVLPEDK